MPTNPFNIDRRTAWYTLAALLAVFVYFYGLDSQYIPKNGDEFPYAHITRLTADSGRLLPLQSQLAEMRNTKPPLLFWQGILSTDWGHEWTLWHLRYPGVLYTLLTAVLLFLTARRITQQSETGFIASLAFLAFFSTYRFGRPFLTNPPEVFWLFLPFFALLFWKRAAFDSRFLFPLSAGLAIGIGLLYKSFVLLAPVGVTLAWWTLHERQYRIGTFLVRDAWKLVAIGSAALGVFCLWFVLDPDPQAIVNEFILGENFGKMVPHGGSYLSRLLWGGSSVWSMVLSFLSNAGLLVFPFVAVIYMAIARRGRVDEPEKLLWIWVLIQLFFFCLPSQRSGRYLLDVMPAVALLLALNWQRIHRLAFILGIVCSGIVMAGLGYLSLRLQSEAGGAALYSPAYWLFLCGALSVATLAIFSRSLTRPVGTGGGPARPADFRFFPPPFRRCSGEFQLGSAPVRRGQGRLGAVQFQGEGRRIPVRPAGCLGARLCGRRQPGSARSVRALSPFRPPDAPVPYSRMARLRGGGGTSGHPQPPQQQGTERDDPGR